MIERICCLNKYYILIFSFFFLYISGIYENIAGKFPECIGVCNNPGELNSQILLISAIFYFAVISFSINLISKINVIFESNWNFSLFFILIACIASLYVTSWSMDSDDRWLAYRLTKNVLNYGLYFWNPGEYINISTPVVWPYIASVSHLISKYFSIPWNESIKLLGISIYALTAFYVTLMTKLDRKVIFFVFAGIVTYFPLAYWSISGLETCLACLYLLMVLYRIYINGFTYINWLLYSGIIFIRPELILAPSFTLFAIILIRGFDNGFKYLIKPIICLCIVAGGWLFLNYIIWGDLFPTPFYLKTLFHSPFTVGFSSSFKAYNAFIHFLSSTAQSIFLFISLIVLIYITYKYLINKSTHNSNSDQTYTVVVLFIGFLSVATYHILQGYVHMSYIFRYFVPENIAFILIAGFAFQDRIQSETEAEAVADSSNPCYMIKLLSFTTAFILFQLPIFYISGVYSDKVELSLTRAKHRDAFSGSTYAVMMKEWRDIGLQLKQLEQPNDRLWAKDGTNLAGASLTNMYALDGYFTPLNKSKFKQISECKDKDCANYFNYIMIRDNDSDWTAYLLSNGFKQIINSSGVLVFMNSRSIDGN